MNSKIALPDEYGDDDDFFLSEAAAVAEAHALSLAKRYRSTPSYASATAKADEGKPRLQEGAYLAALRADDAPRQQQRQQQNFSSLPSRVKVAAAAAGGDQLGFGGEGACFKCGESGHWARDCPSAGAAGGAIGRSQSSEPEKACPCGVGVCTVLTANTEKNRGRRFYKCPVREGASCGFFKWCNDQTDVAAGFPSVATKGYNNSANNTNLRSYGTTGGSSCFKCGKEGHWAKDCPLSANVSTAPIRNPSSASGLCYKCGNPGHWARDCTNSKR